MRFVDNPYALTGSTQRPIGRFRAVVLAAALVFSFCGCTEGESARDVETRQQRLARQLNSLSYVTSSPVAAEHRGLRNVVTHEEEHALQGLNLYGSLTHTRAHLRTMTGDLLHTWSTDGVFSDREDFVLSADTLDMVNLPFSPGLAVAEIHDDHLLVIEPLSGLVKLDWNSRVVFALNNNAHHDLDTSPDGSIFALTAVPRWVDTGMDDTIIIDDVIEKISPEGVRQQSYSIFEFLASNPDIRPLLSAKLRSAMDWFADMESWQNAMMDGKTRSRPAYEAMYRLYDETFVRKSRSLQPCHQLYVLYLTPADILHCNTLQVLPGRDDGLWAEGNVLVSVRDMDLVAVLDLDARAVVWWWGPGEISHQHQPSILANGNLLIFDNGTATGRSRVLELDPATREIVWSYGETPTTAFYCGAMGGAQGLANDNVLITDSAKGRAFEVDRAGRIVWDFFNPDHGYNPFEMDAGDESIEAIYRLVRVDDQLAESLVGR